jgi:hypothetical protein
MSFEFLVLFFYKNEMIKRKRIIACSKDSAHEKLLSMIANNELNIANWDRWAWG